MKVVPVLLCGGAGTRLWPASREDRPKQFVPLLGDCSTFQQTVLRVADPGTFDRPIVICNESYRDLVAQQLAEASAVADIVLEPCRRDSGPAILAGALWAERRRAGSVVLALPTDHVVKQPETFREACRIGRASVAGNRILTFGVRPDRPSSEYGYIRPAGDRAPGPVAAFVEKPDFATAEKYVAADYLWNSGNFMFRADVLAAEYGRFDPQTLAFVRAAISQAQVDGNAAYLHRESFEAATRRSFDYAVMEKTALADVLPISVGWSDVGSWQALWELSDKDPNNNAANGRAVFESAHNCCVISDRATVAVHEVDDIVVIVDGDTILVSRRGANMRTLVGKLKAEAPDLLKTAT